MRITGHTIITVVKPIQNYGKHNVHKFQEVDCRCSSNEILREDNIDEDKGAQACAQGSDYL